MRGEDQIRLKIYECRACQLLVSSYSQGTYDTYLHWRQTGLKSGGAEWEFETYLVKFDTYLVKFETYSVIRDYETKKTAGAPEPPSLAPMYMYIYYMCIRNEILGGS